MVVIICTYNSEPWVDKNLDALFSQNYKNFRVIYVDDGSTDGTANKVEKYIQEHKLQDKIILIRNKQRTRKLKNVYRAYHMPEDYEVIVIYDGDDWYPHPNVLQNINKTYQTHDVWFTHGQFINYPGSQIGWGMPTPKHIIEQRAFRKFRWIYSQPRTFYAWLFKLIRLEDLLTESVPDFVGDFYPCSNDRAIVYPMLEMAHHRIAFIPEPAYVVNRSNPISTGNFNSKERQTTVVHCRNEHINKPIQYDRLSAPIINRMEQFKNAKADIIFFSKNLIISNVIDSINTHIKNIENFYVLYEGSVTTKATSQNIKNRFNNITLIDISQTDKEYLLTILRNTPSNHILIFDANSFQNDGIIDCNQLIHHLEKTFAFGLYTNVSSERCKRFNVPHQHIYDNVYAWKFSHEKNNILKNYKKSGCFRKNTIIEQLKLLYEWSFEAIQTRLTHIPCPTKSVGLFFDRYNN